jgi:hypothetical protein
MSRIETTVIANPGKQSVIERPEIYYRQGVSDTVTHIFCCLMGNLGSVPSNGGWNDLSSYYRLERTELYFSAFNLTKFRVNMQGET